MIAETIFKQLGGQRFIVMTGCKHFSQTTNGIQFKVGKNANGINHCRIDLDGSDLYKVEFLRVTRSRYKIVSRVVSEHQGIFADQLRAVFEQATGLYTSLGTMGVKS